MDEADSMAEFPPGFGEYHHVVHIPPVEDPISIGKCVIEWFQVQRTKEWRDRSTSTKSDTGMSYVRFCQIVTDDCNG